MTDLFSSFGETTQVAIYRFYFTSYFIKIIITSGVHNLLLWYFAGDYQIWKQSINYNENVTIARLTAVVSFLQLRNGVCYKVCILSTVFGTG